MDKNIPLFNTSYGFILTLEVPTKYNSRMIHQKRYIQYQTLEILKTNYLK